jgi:hypothetical protein
MDAQLHPQVICPEIAGPRIDLVESAAASTSRADVAHFLLGELELGVHVRQIVGMAQ